MRGWKDFDQVGRGKWEPSAGWVPDLREGWISEDVEVERSTRLVFNIEAI
jgi:hypothetical protein